MNRIENLGSFVQCIIEIIVVHNDAVGGLTHLDAVMVGDVHCLGGIGGDKLIGIQDVVVAHQMANVNPHFNRVEHVTVAHGIPGILEVVFTKGNVNARVTQFFDPGHPPAFRITIEAPTQVGVDQGIGNKINVGKL